jgi:DHA1 family bicyclomycin/chloramphenicol resistance-like MFS transporter
VACATKRVENPRQLATLAALLAMLAPFSIDTYLPSFPEIQAAFAIGPALLQQTLSFYLLAFAVTTLIYGPLADGFGRRRVALGALALFIVASVGAALAADFSTLLAMRVVQGLSASAGVVIGRAIIRDAFSGVEARRAMSRMMLLFMLAPALAPIIGGWLHTAFGWRSVFVFLALFAAAIGALAWRCLPETLAHEHRQSVHPLAIGRNYGRALAHGPFMLLVMVFAFNFGGMFLYVVGSPALIYTHLGLGAEEFAVLFVPLVAGMMAGTFATGRLAGRLGPVDAIRIGLAAMSAGALLNVGLALLLPPSAAGVIGPMVLYAFGLAFSLPSLTLLTLDYFPMHRGMASAAQAFVQTAGNAAVAGVIVPLAATQLLSMAASAALLHGTALMLWIAWRRFAVPALP